jgi:hypothetical protein
VGRLEGGEKSGCPAGTRPPPGSPSRAAGPGRRALGRWDGTSARKRPRGAPHGAMRPQQDDDNMLPIPLSASPPNVPSHRPTPRRTGIERPGHPLSPTVPESRPGPFRSVATVGPPWRGRRPPVGLAARSAIRSLGPTDRVGGTSPGHDETTSGRMPRQLWSTADMSGRRWGAEMGQVRTYDRSLKYVLGHRLDNLDEATPYRR